jgi:histidinol phosphatase-like enzyme
MLLRAAGLLGINLDNSWIVGDASDDLAAGRSAGLRGGVLVMTGRGVTQRDAAVALSSPEFEVVVAPSIRNVTGLIPLLADL